MTTKKAIICDDCKQQVKVTSLCICGMWTCVTCTLSERHDTRIGEHWKMLAKYHNIDTTWPPKGLQKWLYRRITEQNNVDIDSNNLEFRV